MLQSAVLLVLLNCTQNPVGVGESVEALSARSATEHFLIHHREGSRAGAAVDRVAALIEPEYERILRALEARGLVDESEPFHLFLYDDLEELERITGVSGTGGFSTGRESHIPYDNDQTRLHEVVHIVAAAMPTVGPEERNLFLVEGVANAVLEFVHGTHVHAVAAFDRQTDQLPELETLLGQADYYQYLSEHPHFNGYDVGGSFMLFLLEAYNRKRVMRFYHGVPFRKALGVSLEQAERNWHALLDSYPLRPGLKTLLAERRGDSAEFTTYAPPEPVTGELPEELLGTPDQWTELLAVLEPADMTGTWKLNGEVARGDNASASDWSLCQVPGRLYTDCVLRASIRPGSSCWGVQLRLGAECQAMVLGQGAFIYYQEQHGIAFSDKHKLGRQELDLVLRVRDGTSEVWINGVHVLEANTPVKPAAVGLGLVGGQAEFREFRVRPL